MTKYDDASWHYGGAFPDDLRPEAASTHIGIFLAWCVLHDLAEEETLEDLGEDLDLLYQRKMTPGAFLRELFDEKFSSDDLSSLGNAFAVAYYVGKNDDALYVDDYLDLFNVQANDIYSVPDTWETFDKLSPIILERYRSWELSDMPRFLNP
ncbi:hypothetical protein AUR04nite_22800 [Glutamicibacter uratoxydans]|uniref:DUF7832 domain-containing protein n=1 Tax=Glutamicibacter uratoxydans TaxID=43667 RepID=A0A4Y4DTR6_GLUUR|nr:hypothetical protein [Glutamicibacter uratoxydans]GED06748.1 hypothetical protein AUR04nite_22800 [Glutamicibacter uratoxydans]